MKLEHGQVAVVTGAASGIGFALAEALCARGLSVVLADVEATALETAQTSLNARGFVVHAHACDVADAAAVDGLADAVLTRFGRVDLLVNNAGVGGRLGPLWDSQLAGIEADDFLILTHADLNGQVRARLASVERAARKAA
jgi:NAD(P)-dependent dehydrogenase (short-subunit alcohol dehydrogenase family)